MLLPTNKTVLALAGLVLFFGLSTAASNAELSERDRVLASVRALQPALQAHQAGALSAALLRVSADPHCGVAWQILLSVAFQESSLNRLAVNGDTEDYGLMQINARNISRLRLDRGRLMTDIAYSLRAGCTILSKNREMYGHFPYWIGVYRAGTAFNNPRIVSIAKRYHRQIASRALRMGYKAGR